MRIIRVFPRKTNASPDDVLARFGVPGMFDEADEVHISVTFTYDLPRAEHLAHQWRAVAPVTVGGPATGMRGEEFEAGKYVKRGYTITSRGCPNRCWFCSVWKRDGTIRELPIVEGWNLLDDNLLACSEKHIRQVFEMLKKQKRRAEFTGGLEAARLKGWHVDLLTDIKPTQMFFAYDTRDDYEPLVMAGKMLRTAGFRFRARRAYVLIGYPKDTFTEAERRLWQTVRAGFLPMAMVYRNRDGKKTREWQKLQKAWARPAVTMAMIQQNGISVTHKEVKS